MALKKKFFYLLSSGKAVGLKEVEWLRNNYNTSENEAPYIDTGIKNSWDSPLEVIATTQRPKANRFVIIGNYNASLSFNIEIATGGNLRFYATESADIDPTYTMVDTLTSGTLSLDVPYKVWLKLNPLNDASHTVNYELGFESLEDSSVTETITGTLYRSGSSSQNLCLFMDPARVENKRSVFDDGQKIHQIEIKQVGNYKKFIPCLDDSNVPCMYEQIGKQLYYNAGTGSFDYGRWITEVEYLKLTGTQRFGTGFHPNTLDTTLRTTYEVTAETLARFPMGVRRYAGYGDSCAMYIAGTSNSFPNGYLRLDWALQEGTTRYLFSPSAELLNIEMTGNYANINGTEYTTTGITSYTHPYEFYIGTTYTASTGNFQSGFIGKMYFVELLNTYTREDYRYCVPAHDENNVGFFFDRTNHFIMDNLSNTTDEITWGDEIHPVEYLYGGYPDRYNTGIVCYDHKWETDVRYDAERPYYNLIGAATGAANYWGMVRSGSDVGTYTVHTSSSTFSLSIDPTITRTVFVETGRNESDTSDFISMTVEGENKQRTTTTANRQAGYRLLAIASGSSYLGEVYVYGNRCYDRTSGKLLQNLIPVQNENKVGYFLDTLSHVLIANDEAEDTTEKGAGQIGYSVEPELPYGMTRLNYIESTGTQYIEIDTKPNADYGVEIDAKQTYTSSGTTRYLFGTYDSSNIENYYIAVSSGNGNFTVAVDSSSVEGIYAYDGSFHNHKIDAGKYYIDGTLIGDIEPSSFTQTSTVRLFGCNNTGVNADTWQVRSCKIYDDSGKIISHLVPVLRAYDNKVGMFDLIRRVFLNNIGTGDFVYA